MDGRPAGSDPCGNGTNHGDGREGRRLEGRWCVGWSWRRWEERSSSKWDGTINVPGGLEKCVFSDLPSSSGTAMFDAQGAEVHFRCHARMMSGDCPIPLQWCRPRGSVDCCTPGGRRGNCLGNASVHSFRTDADGHANGHSGPSRTRYGTRSGSRVCAGRPHERMPAAGRRACTLEPAPRPLAFSGTRGPASWDGEKWPARSADPELPAGRSSTGR